MGHGAAGCGFLACLQKTHNTTKPAPSASETSGRPYLAIEAGAAPGQAGDVAGRGRAVTAGGAEAWSPRGTAGAARCCISAAAAS